MSESKISELPVQQKLGNLATPPGFARSWDFSYTWDSPGTTFLGGYLNFTDTNSATASSVLNIAVNNILKVGFRKDGMLTTGDVAFTQTGTDAVERGLKVRALDTVSRSDFSTLAQARTAAGLKPLIDPTTGKMWLTVDSAPLDYSTSRAGFVFQHRDTASGAANELIPGAVDQFNVTGNGVVNSGTELSQTIWQGRYMFMNKTGDGSAHSATAIGQLGAVGVGGYNELGGYQGELTNIGSVLGTISGVEMLLKDSPDAGASTYSTKMEAIVGRIAKYNPTVRKSFHFYASSEGTQYTNACLGVNPNGNKFQRGFDFGDADFSSGQFGLVPNNTFLAWKTAGAVAVPVVGVSAANAAYVAMPTTTSSVIISTTSFATRLEVDNNATDALLIWTNGALKRVTVNAIDTAGAGFRALRVPN